MDENNANSLSVHSISSPSDGGAGKKSQSKVSSAGGESTGAGGSTSSNSPKMSRSRREEDSIGNRDSEGEKPTTIKKKPKEKKGFFGVSLFSIFSSPHRHKNHEMHKIFTSLPTSEKLIDDYSCALQRDILIHGRLYITQSWLCFYANIFSWETLLTIPFQSVKAITKEKTALFIPNAIQVAVSSEKYGFSSLISRDVAYNIIFKCWQNNLLNQPLTPLELVKAARKAHGESTDVGTEVDLWGEEPKETTESSGLDIVVQSSMPTHLKIPTTTDVNMNSNHLTATTISHSRQRSLPAGELHDKMEGNHHSSNLQLSNGHSSQQRHGRSPSLHLINGHSPGHSPSHKLSNGMSKDENKQQEEGKNILAEPAVNAAVSSLYPAASENKSQSPSIPSSHSADHADVTSSVGDSGGSAEYETVSLIEDIGEVPCDCKEHIGRTILNEVYNSDLETLFRLLFTDSDFMKIFNKAEKTSNVVMGEWQMQSDNSRLRDISYTVSLNYSFGPKFTNTNEHQIYSKFGQPGIKHIVDTEVVNQGIPYGDTFYTVCRYCITRVAHNQTRLRVTASVKYKKSCWGLVKNLIERNAGDGLRTHFTLLDTVLKEYMVSLPEIRKRTHRRVSRHSRRHKRLPSVKTPTPTHTTPIPTPISEEGVKDESPSKSMDSVRPPSVAGSVKSDETLEKKDNQKDSFPRVNLALTLLLGVLIISNMILYHHLMSYNNIPLSTDKTLPTENLFPSYTEERTEWPTAKEDWYTLLQQLKSEEVNQLKNTLLTFIQTLEKIETSINSAKKQFLSSLEDLNKKSMAFTDGINHKKQDRTSGPPYSNREKRDL